jgi:hypothetical protein
MAGRATLSAVPSINTRLEAKMVERSVHFWMEVKDDFILLHQSWKIHYKISPAKGYQ